jgi:protein-arginine deiminase
VNGVYLRRGLFLVPRQHGPRVDRRDLFAAAIRRALRPLGIAVRFAETSPHANGAGAGGGEVHCLSNTLRGLAPIASWWDG